MNIDVAIIGGGAAGLSAALSVPKTLKVAVFVKRKLLDCASARAQGGIAAALSADDTIAAHIADTLHAGDGLCNESAAQQIITAAPAAIQWLITQGVRFNHCDNNLSLAREGGHSARRIAHIDDRSGQAIIAALVARIKQHSNITVMENAIAINLSVTDGVCRGFYALHLTDGTISAINARATIIASGGAGKVYLYATTPTDATGDGIAMAYRANCQIRNMEFVQFHPTCLFHPHSPSFLITEAIRGEGARLVNAAGDFFMETGEESELSPRDRVARAIDAEMKKTGADCVYLDLSAHPPNFWRQRFPTIMRQCDKLQVDVARIPVVPAAHYCCGGIHSDVQGRTDVRGLLAVGEAAGNGLHGANRLASNSLLECIVGGRNIAATIGDGLVSAAVTVPPWDQRRISDSAENIMVAHNWDELRRIMWNYVGIVRSDERLIRARRRIEWIDEEIEEFYARHAVSRDFLELRNLVQCAALIIEGALSRRESRGLHFNKNCPNRAAVATDTILRRQDFSRRRRAINNKCPFSARPVVANGLTDYAGQIVGFCNPQCRNTFAAAAAANFVNAEPAMVAAKNDIDMQIHAKK